MFITSLYTGLWRQHGIIPAVATIILDKYAGMLISRPVANGFTVNDSYRIIDFCLHTKYVTNMTLKITQPPFVFDHIPLVVSTYWQHFHFFSSPVTSMETMWSEHVIESTQRLRNKSNWDVSAIIRERTNSHFTWITWVEINCTYQAASKAIMCTYYVSSRIRMISVQNLD